MGKTMSVTSKPSSKDQISIPKAVRERLGWRPGQKIAFIDHSTVMVPVPDREALAGMARGANTNNYRDRDDRY
jgi:AbrB family looped-hinge helix DNA binding protein